MYESLSADRNPAGHEAQPRGSRVALALPRALHLRVHLEGETAANPCERSSSLRAIACANPCRSVGASRTACAPTGDVLSSSTTATRESLDHRVEAAPWLNEALVVIQTDAVRLIARVVYFPVHEQRLVRDLPGDAQIRLVEADDAIDLARKSEAR